MPLNLEPERRRIEEWERVKQAQTAAEAQAAAAVAARERRLGEAVALLADEAVVELRRSGVPMINLRATVTGAPYVPYQQKAPTLVIPCWDLRFPREMFNHPYRYTSPAAYLTPGGAFIENGEYGTFVPHGATPLRVKAWPYNWRLDEATGRVAIRSQRMTDGRDIDHAPSCEEVISYADEFISRLVVAAIHEQQVNPRQPPAPPVPPKKPSLLERALAFWG